MGSTHRRWKDKTGPFCILRSPLPSTAAYDPFLPAPTRMSLYRVLVMVAVGGDQSRLSGALLGCGFLEKQNEKKKKLNGEASPDGKVYIDLCANAHPFNPVHKLLSWKVGTKKRTAFGVD